jgi:excisionase family DNA binding protein
VSVLEICRDCFARARGSRALFDLQGEIVVQEELIGLSQERLPRLLDIGGVAEHLGVTERHVRRVVAERRIPFVKWGHLLRFDPDEIALWLDGVRVPPIDGVARSR